MKLRVVLLALLAAIVAGCGGEEGEREQAAPKLPPQLAADLAQRSDVVAERLEANDSCAAQEEAEALQEQAIAALNEGRVPARYQEELTSAVNALVASIECVPPVELEPPPPTVQETHHDEPDEEEDDD